MSEGVRQSLHRLKLPSTLSRFVCVWNGRSYRIGLIDYEVNVGAALASRIRPADSQ